MPCQSKESRTRTKHACILMDSVAILARICLALHVEGGYTPLEVWRWLWRGVANDPDSVRTPTKCHAVSLTLRVSSDRDMSLRLLGEIHTFTHSKHILLTSSRVIGLFELRISFDKQARRGAPSNQRLAFAVSPEIGIAGKARPDRPGRLWGRDSASRLSQCEHSSD